MTDKMIQDANDIFNEMIGDMPAMQSINGEFEDAYARFADGNEILTHLEINSPPTAEWVKHVAELFYAKGRGHE